MSVRIGKFSVNTSFVIDLHPNSLSFSEYDPINPGAKWGGQIELLRGKRIQVTVGPYNLIAEEKSAPGHYQGIETGPHGEFEIDLILFRSDAQALFEPPKDSWACFGDGTFQPAQYAYMVPAKDEDYIPLRRGACILQPSPIDDTVLTGQSIWRGESWDGKFSHWPKRTDSDQTLSFDFALHGHPKYMWGYGGGQKFRPDIINGCYRSTTDNPNRVLYPADLDTDLYKTLKKHR